MYYLRLLILPLLIIGCLSVSSCGGDEQTEDSSEKTTSETTTTSDDPGPIVKEELVVEKKEKKIIPNPNGVYLPTGEEKNGKPVYENQEGFSMWFDGASWKITDKTGGGKVVSLGKDSINEKWQNGARARFYPDEDYAKDATFRLAVAFQGSKDNKNAIRLFEQFVMDYPNDNLVAEVYLSLGDLSISEVNPDDQPNFEQITNARKNYSLVRKSSQDIGLISDATFNEGGLLERVAENPEGIVNFYYTFDKNKDEILQKQEFAGADLNTTKPFDHFDLDKDGGLDFEELFELATFETYSNVEKLYRDYQASYSNQEGARVSEATEKVGFACEKLGRPSEMLKCTTTISRSLVMILRIQELITFFQSMLKNIRNTMYCTEIP